MNRPAEVSDLLDVFRAIRMRKPQGSATEFNRLMAADLSDGSMTGPALDAARSGGLSVLSRVKEQGQRTWLGRNTNALAELFTSSDSDGRIPGIIELGAQSHAMASLRRHMLQLG